MVSGQVTPDTYYISAEKALLVITKKLIGKKRSMLSANLGELEGTSEIEVPPDTVYAQALPDAMILDLVRQGMLYASHYNYLCDIEWAYYKEKLYILQIRPVTALITQSN
jgi:phosphoenolpyruvate synthase/pyruvate phosphate dikinase